VLGNVGRVSAALCDVVALARSIDAADRTGDVIRAGLILLALGGVAYETFAIVPAMTAITTCTHRSLPNCTRVLRKCTAALSSGTRRVGDGRRSRDA